MKPHIQIIATAGKYKLKLRVRDCRKGGVAAGRWDEKTNVWRWRRTRDSATSNWDCVDLRYGPSACSIWVCETLEPEIEICVCVHMV